MTSFCTSTNSPCQVSRLSPALSNPLPSVLIALSSRANYMLCSPLLNPSPHPSPLVSLLLAPPPREAARLSASLRTSWFSLKDPEEPFPCVRLCRKSSTSRLQRSCQQMQRDLTRGAKEGQDRRSIRGQDISHFELMPQQMTGYLRAPFHLYDIIYLTISASRLESLSTTRLFCTLLFM